MKMPSPVAKSFEHYNQVMEAIHNNYTPHSTASGEKNVAISVKSLKYEQTLAATTITSHKM